jgi:hypothetical protein
VVSLAVAGVLAQLAVIYALNALHKDGATWREGTAVHYVLHQDRIATWLALQLRPHLSLGGSRALSWSALATEALLPVLILSPVLWRYTRRLAIALGVGLHVGFALLLNLGLFSFNMIGFFLLLIGAADWELGARFVAARPALQRRLAAVTGAVRARAERFVHGWLRPVPAGAALLAPWPRKLARAVPFAREATCAVYMFALAGELTHANRGVPAWMHVARPELMRMLVGYPRIYQGWSMFAPDAPMTDMHVFVDAVTSGGRHVDPLNELGSRVATTPLTAIPDRLGLDDGVCDYITGLGDAPEYYGALQDWIFAYDQRTGRARDRVVSFKVWLIEDDSPPPGKTRPGPARTRLLSKGRR